MYQKNHCKYAKAKISTPKYKPHRQIKREYEKSVIQGLKSTLQMMKIMEKPYPNKRDIVRVENAANILEQFKAIDALLKN